MGVLCYKIRMSDWSWIFISKDYREELVICTHHTDYREESVICTDHTFLHLVHYPLLQQK